jgi:uncharacterized protein (DUF2252 family)
MAPRATTQRSRPRPAVPEQAGKRQQGGKPQQPGKRQQGGKPQQAGKISQESAWERRHLSVEEREASGRAARSAAPRSAHADWQPAPDRPDPVALLEEQSAGRVPELVPVRYGRMLVSPFTFYRGAALIMTADLANTPRSGIEVQLCGDAHLSNFGVFGTPERRMIFDINDFDETLPGPWEWDLKRLAVSFEVMGRDRGFRPADRRAIVLTAAREYRERMRRAAAQGTLEVWYEQLETGDLMKLARREARGLQPSKSEQRRAQRNLQQARTRDSARVFAKRTDEAGGEPRIVAQEPLITPVEELVEAGSEWEHSDELIRDLLQAYRQTLGGQHHPIEEFRYVHAARKVVGVGSVGTRCYIVLMLGRDDDDPLFIQVKEAQSSVLERFAGASAYDNHGERVVAGQRLMQAASDIFLGWITARGLDGRVRDFYIRQFQDWKGSADTENMMVPGATFYAQICGATLARAHARYGDRIALASYLGGADNFDNAIADFAVAYADQNERDYDAFSAAVKTGRLQAQVGL